MTVTVDLSRASRPLASGTSTADRVATSLRQEIQEGRLLPGTPLRDQRAAERFGVSRNTIRDALRLLVAEGLVESRLHSGSAVRRLKAHDVRDIYKVRRVVECSAVVFSALATEALLAEVEIAVRRAEEAMARREWGKVGTASLDFHRALVGLSDSARLNAFCGTLLAQLRLAFAVMKDEGSFQLQWIVRDREIAELVLSGRRDEAVHELNRYLDDSEALVVDAVRSQWR
ncbi:MAG: GntR family transcriptional regulator [Nocardioidaceae bacterium]|nr:GntR family transcriptional regulator [Nocardioidaceae bacterium]